MAVPVNTTEVYYDTAAAIRRNEERISALEKAVEDLKKPKKDK